MAILSQFIRDHTEEILAEWETFARTLPMADTMNVPALRDHAKEMLSCIATDLGKAQSAQEQADKAEGKSDAPDGGPPETAAQEHGAARAESGFTVEQMLSELRALRACVIRLWMKDEPKLLATDLEDVIRFNEAIDQAIAESMTQYSEEIGNSKERFLAILGHDLRNPLGAIIMSSSLILEVHELAPVPRDLVTRIGNSARRMNQMVSDLLDFARTRFGGDSIPIQRQAMDVTKMVNEVASEVGARYPAHPMRVETDGDLQGQWDCARLTQALTNLVGNAVQHGSKTTPISIVAHGLPTEVVISVRNEGPTIALEDLSQVFMSGRRAGDKPVADDGHLGLGLFIVDRIVAAHGGTVGVKSTAEDGTTFTVNLPRAA